VTAGDAPDASHTTDASAAVPQLLRARAAEIDTALEAALERLLPRSLALDPSVAPALDHLRGFLAGGKRIRPVLLLLGFEAAGGRDRSAVHGPALALELLHTCALLHDDVIDRAPTRRGRPTVHTAVADEHRVADWQGDAEGYGEAVAILLGDLAFVYADELFLEARVPDRTLLAAFRRFGVLREEVMVGQYLDLHAATSGSGGRDVALAIATLKSGRYSVARPLELGAALAGAEESLLAGLRAFGDPLGRAFQLRDDLLGVFGEEATTGKSVSSDLREGKRTLLVAEALDRAEPADADVLRAGLGASDLTAAAADRLRAILDGSGARSAVEARVEAELADARRALGDLRLPPSAGVGLREVADYLGARSS
jgi:geranylgeranyl diphosphate synthase, type I